VEVSDDSAAGEGLAFTEVFEAQVLDPNGLHGVEVLNSDGKDFTMYNPIYHF
jgi:hypothetical protein